MGFDKSSYRRQFYNNPVVNNDIRYKFAHNFAILKHRDRLLTLCSWTGLAQFNHQAFLINTLELSKSHFIVHPIGTIDYFLVSFAYSMISSILRSFPELDFLCLAILFTSLSRLLSYSVYPVILSDITPRRDLLSGPLHYSPEPDDCNPLPGWRSILLLIVAPPPEPGDLFPYNPPL